MGSGFHSFGSLGDSCLLCSLTLTTSVLTLAPAQVLEGYENRLKSMLWPQRNLTFQQYIKTQDTHLHTVCVLVTQKQARLPALRCLGHTTHWPSAHLPHGVATDLTQWHFPPQLMRLSLFLSDSTQPACEVFLETCLPLLTVLEGRDALDIPLTAQHMSHVLTFSVIVGCINE